MHYIIEGTYGPSLLTIAVNGQYVGKDSGQVSLQSHLHNGTVALLLQVQDPVSLPSAIKIVI